MKKSAKLLFLLLCAMPFLRIEATNIPVDDTDIPSPLTSDFDNFDDSLVTLMSNLMNDFPQYTDEEYRQRLQELSGLIDYRLDPLVKERIIIRTETYRTSTENLLGKSDIYFPIFEEHLAKYNVPHHLKYLAIVESHLNPVAKSVASAVGLWQFIPSSGKMFGLEINNYVDERSDTYKASEAAAKLLSVLFAKYGDWSLAMAAYNCGAGRVDGAIRAAKGNTDYWTVRNFLPKETQKYVPFFMAMVYVGEFYENHELKPERMPQDYVLTDTIHMSGGISMFDLAKNLEISIDTLKFLNPAYRRNYVPQSNKGQIIVLPARIVSQLRGYQAAFSRVLSIQKNNPIRAVRRINSTKDLEWLCKAYRCTLEDILQWNELPANYQPQEGDLIALRKINVATGSTAISKRNLTIETIAISAMKVIAIDPKSQKVNTTAVYMPGKFNDVVAQTVKVDQPVKAATTRHRILPKDPAPAQNKDIIASSPNVPKAGSYDNAGGQRIGAAAAMSAPVASVQLSEESTNDRSRARRFRQHENNNATDPDTEEVGYTVESSYSETKVEKATYATVETTVSGNPLVPSEMEKQVQPIATEQKMEVVSSEINKSSQDVGFDRNRARNLRGAADAAAVNPVVVQKQAVAQPVAMSIKSQEQSFSDEAHTYYRVQSGETAWDVKAKYPHINVQQLLEENKLEKDSELRAGMILKISK